MGIALTPGYSAWSDAISELVERGAARKGLVDPLLLLHHALVIPKGMAILIAIWLVATAMRFSPHWRGFVMYSRATVITGAGLAVLTVACAETQHVGVLERLLTWS